MSVDDSTLTPLVTRLLELLTRLHTKLIHIIYKLRYILLLILRLIQKLINIPSLSSIRLRHNRPTIIHKLLHLVILLRKVLLTLIVIGVGFQCQKGLKLLQKGRVGKFDMWVVGEVIHQHIDYFERLLCDLLVHHLEDIATVK